MSLGSKRDKAKVKVHVIRMIMTEHQILLCTYMRSFYIISLSFRSSNTLHCIYCCIKTQTPLQCRTICSWLSRCSIRFSLWHHGYQAVMVDMAWYRSKHLWSPLLGSLDQLHLSYVICIKRCIHFSWNKKALDRCRKISALKQVLCQEIDINLSLQGGSEDRTLLSN